jgi:hypothetical protein
MIGGLNGLSWERLKPEYDECGQLLAIFTSISNFSHLEL